MQTPQTSIDIQRPTIHFTPHAGWINDPNGLVYLDGEYYLFYQHHPHSTVWGPMHWGHAVSRDLVKWQELPIALAPDHIGAIFSGSVVNDRNNTAGFGAGAMVAIFTHQTENPNQRQVQSIAYSLDRGRTWAKYAGNPVLRPPAGLNDFRDPKVFWYDDGIRAHWVMALAVASEIFFYRSTNLKDWTESSRFGAERGSHGGVWECPELMLLNIEGSDEKRWVLIVSVGNGAPAGGSGVQYFVGQFDGTTFTSQDAPDRIRWADYGADFYALQAWNDAPDGRKLCIAWMNNWAYGNQIPASTWRGSMSIPREIALQRDGDDVVLVQRPVPELNNTGRTKLTWQPRQIDCEVIAIDSASDVPRELHLSVRIASSNVVDGAAFGIRIGEGDAAVLIGYRSAHQQLFIQRPDLSGTAPGFAATHVAPLSLRDGQLDLHLILDTCSVEVFTDQGRLTMTDQLFLPRNGNALTLFAQNIAVAIGRLEIREFGH